MRSIAGYNEAAKRGKETAMKYCQQWQSDITRSGTDLAADYTNKKMDKTTYNIKREMLNKQTRDLNDCIQSINRRFGV